MIHLRSIATRQRNGTREGFPFNVPIIRTLGEIQFTSPVTFLVGENGCGKSTILEAIACAVQSVTVGSDPVESDQTLSSVRALADSLSQTWTKRTRKGFFLRAEDFFGYAKRMSRIRAEAAVQLDAIEVEYAGRSELAKGLARMPHARTIAELKNSYGEGLDAQSHGESFIKLFQSRLVSGGLYLLDEPEAPLSPLRQLAFLSLLKEMVANDCQFIIATHSPIILSFPGAAILSCDSAPIEAVEYDDLEHVKLTREFLNNPEQYLRRL